ncbi:hypothetical protein RJT34_25406 [Clitoria ternatea]|uniref:PGG domain-containing protein n=1 Tax=Clitoria ternatea TaxID=43366 RepID=A0AAN9IGU2_CLITE
MDPRLVEAASTGNVGYLHSLMRENMLLLHTVSLVGAETPLHIASMCGHLSFVKEMLKQKKQFAYELNQDAFTPLHLASAIGHIQIVKELLKLDHNICAIQGREQRLPIHCAVVKGRIDVMRELLSACPSTIESKTARGETLLHLAVKNNQFDALRLLVECLKVMKKEHVLNEKDNHGTTVLHLAASRKQYQVINFLLVDDNVAKEVIEVNSLNEVGMSALDVLTLFQSEAGDLEIHTSLVKAGARRGNEVSSSDPHNIINKQVHKPNMQPLAELEIIHDDKHNEVAQKHTSDSKESDIATRIRYWPRLEELTELFGYKTSRDTINDVRGILLTVATLLASTTYQAALSPPGGLWQDDSDGHSAGKSIMGTKSEATFWLFLVGNSVGFYTSLHMILWLTTGFPLQYPLLLLAGSISLNYSGSMISMVPAKTRLLATASVAIAFGYLAPWIPSVIRRLSCRRRA